MRTDLLEKLRLYTIKKKELETLLLSLGFTCKPGKGSHVKWMKAGLPTLIIATHDKDLKDYQIKQAINVLKAGGFYEEGKKGEETES